MWPQYFDRPTRATCRARLRRGTTALAAMALAVCASMALEAHAAPSDAATTLADRMALFSNGSLRGFALLPLGTDRADPYSEADFRDLAATGANVVRVPIVLTRCDGCPRWTPPDADIAYVERVLGFGAQFGFRVVVVLQPVPWGARTDHWDNEALQADLTRQWGRVAARLKAYPSLQAYDLVNEPVLPGTLSAATAAARWRALAARLARAVRAEDPATPVMIEPLPWGLPSGLAHTRPLDLPGLVYSFHLYAPHAFTHQGLPGHPEARPYPGQGWDKARLSAALEGARRFAASHGVPLFVGEFSCVRWAPQGSCLRYLTDATTLMAAERWGWTYHCWRCFQGWDAEVPEHLPQAQAQGRLPAQRRADSARLLGLKRAMQPEAAGR